MGSWASRHHAGVEEVDIVSNLAYKYPPRTGNYFGSHFIMGGERFDTPQPEAYLFGENADLNFLGCRPTPFPYPPPQANEPTKTLKSLVNIRKESLRFVRSAECLQKASGDGPPTDEVKLSNFNIEFTFDCDARCAITIYYFCTEDFTPNGVIYNPRDPVMNSETFHYKRGANQQFCQVSHVFDPSKFTEEELAYNPDKDVIPIAIHCVAEEGPEDPRQSHTTIAVVDRHLDGSYVLKALKQKLYVDGLCYLLQEIYGIENKNNDNVKASGDEDTEDNGSECVICMCDVRDTLILPCRHLCLCNSCADSLRYQANNCPICRAPFRALLQIRALQKSSSVSQGVVVPPDGSCENIPAGYEAVSLIEALNGACPTRPVPIVPPLDTAETPDQEVAVQAASILSQREDSDVHKRGTSGTPEFRMSVLLALEEENGIKDQGTNSPLLVRHCSREKRPRDSVRLVNEKAATIALNDQEETPDEDSEAEKLSPLLDTITSSKATTVLSGNDDEDDDQDDVEDLDKDEQLPTVPQLSSASNGRTLGVEDTSGHIATGEDSDYYTPEDPATTILSPLHADKERTPSATSNPPSSVESTPGRWAGVGVSLPGTPLSTASLRSSGDSYSSSSSTRQLLATTAISTQDKPIQL